MPHATVPAMRTVIELHGYWLGYAVIGSWAVIAGWGLALRLLPYESTPTFWRAVSVAQVLLALQMLAGLLLLGAWALGAGTAPVPGSTFQSVFHVLYGGVFPAIVLVVGHRMAHQGRMNPHAAFALVGLVNFGLLARAWQTGIMGG